MDIIGASGTSYNHLNWWFSENPSSILVMFIITRRDVYLAYRAVFGRGSIFD